MIIGRPIIGQLLYRCVASIPALRPEFYCPLFQVIQTLKGNVKVLEEQLQTDLPKEAKGLVDNYKQRSAADVILY